MHLYLVMSSPTSSNLNGVTIIEMLVTLAVLAVLATLAAPSFRLLHEKWSVDSVAQSMHSTLLMARSEAIKRGGGIGIQKNANSTSCTNASTNQEWGCGWFIYNDTNNNGTWNAAEPKLYELQLAGKVNIMHNSGGSALKVDRYGMVNGLNARGFTLSPESMGIASSATSSLCMSSGGRIRVIRSASCQ